MYYKNNLNEGLIGIIASRLKEYFSKPVIVITKSNNLFKASARSNQHYNIGYVIKSLIDKKIIDKGGGHSMAAGFTMKNNNLIKLKDFILKDYLSKNKSSTFSIKYEHEILPSAIKTSASLLEQTPEFEIYLFSLINSWYENFFKVSEFKRF